jgi:hypothetical protein
MNKTADSLEKKSLTWWQWILMYPTLLVAISGSIPTLINIFYSIKKIMKSRPYFVKRNYPILAF